VTSDDLQTRGIEPSSQIAAPGATARVAGAGAGLGGLLLAEAPSDGGPARLPWEPVRQESEP